MARVNHKRVKQLLNEKRSKITDKQFFTSRILAGSFEDIAAAQSKRYHYNRRVHVNIYWDSKDPNGAMTNNQSIIIIAQHSTRPPMADEVLEYKGEFWTLSGQRLPYRRDKTQDESFFILTLFAIAKELLSNGTLPSSERIDLAVGLPPEHYGILKDKFRQYFQRNESIHFVYNDQPCTILIRDVFVYPQAFAAIAPQKGQLKHHLRLFLIDIGGYTTDVLLLRSGKPDMRATRS